LHFAPKIPTQWDSYSFKVNFRNQIITVQVSKSGVDFKLDGAEVMEVFVDGKVRSVFADKVEA